MQSHGRRVKQVLGFGLEFGLGVFLAAMLFFALKAPSASAHTATELMPGAALQALPATLCLQDDSSGAFLSFSPTTGAYTFNSCTGVTISGTGLVTVKGNTVSLLHYAPDRRVVATDDLALQRGSAGVQLFNPNRTFTIADRFTGNDTCACAAGGAGH
jgi:hypothetical protein